METVSFGREPTRPRWRMPVVAVLVLVVVGLAVADERLRSTEVADLLERVEASQVTVGLAERKLSSMQQYVRPVLASAGRSSPTGVDLAGLVADVGDEGAERVAAGRPAVQGSGILAWHRSALTARAEYLEYLDAKTAHLASAGSGDHASGAAKRRADRARADAVSALTAVASDDAEVARVEAALTGPWS